MSANPAHDLHSTELDSAAPSLRARVVLALGPTTAIVGVLWGVLQPWRLTLLHPHGQGFWWLLSQPPLYVVLVGVLFRLVVAPGLLDDLEDQEE